MSVSSQIGVKEKRGAEAGAMDAVHEVKHAVDERGDKLRNVQKTSEGLQSSAAEFAKLTKELRNRSDVQTRDSQSLCCCFH